MQPKKFRKMLVSGRAAVGWSAILMPKLLARAWGVRPPLNSEVRYAIRLFGIRNALLSYQLYQAERVEADPEELEEVLRQGIVVDVFDVFFGLGARAKKSGGSFTASIPAITSSIGVLLGFLGREQTGVSESQNE
tara:strand:- start:6342 stop:6746 length:405 start_codon:yes stop_codon:yes gene_type:complete